VLAEPGQLFVDEGYCGTYQEDDDRPIGGVEPGTN
jgi:hypothetical protein